MNTHRASVSHSASAGSGRRLAVALGLLAVVTVSPCLAGQVGSPRWWQTNHAIYCSFALSGAGGPMMKYGRWSSDIRKKLRGPDTTRASFTNLPILLTEARRLGCNCVYLVDYWEPDYAGNKGDYVPRADLGGPAAFAEGIRRIHAAGGKIIVYLEPFIITRNSEVGRHHGREWCMKDAGGNPLRYYGRSEYFLMWPGAGSGWTEYLCALAEKYVRDYGVDGFHLDSYGCQWDLEDGDPSHTGSFNEGAMNLVRTLRQRAQAASANRADPPIVMLECCEQTELLDLCDGGQIESGAWQYSPVKVLLEKPWVRERKYHAYSSHFSMRENARILKMGYNLSLTPWFLAGLPTQKDFATMRSRISNQDDWHKRMAELWHWDNLLFINGIPPPDGVDLFQLRRDLEAARYSSGPFYDLPAYFSAVEAYVPAIRRLLSDGRRIKTMGEWLREFLGRRQPGSSGERDVRSSAG